MLTSDQNTALETICSADQNAVEYSLFDHLFSNDVPEPTSQEAAKARETYYQHIPQLNFSSEFTQEIDDKVAQFITALPDEPLWRHWTANKQTTYLNKTNEKFWRFIDPKNKIVQVNHKMSVPIARALPRLAVTYSPQSLETFGDFLLKEEKALWDMPSDDAAHLICKKMQESYKKSTRGSYHGRQYDEVALNLRSAERFEKTLPTTDKCIGRLQYTDRQRLAHLLNDKFDLKKEISETKLNECLTLKRVKDNYVLRYAPLDHYPQTMGDFIHEQTHRIQEKNTLCFEMGMNFIGLSEEDYTLMRLSFTNYVDAEENFTLYKLNLLEAHANQTDQRAEKILREKHQPA